MAGHDEHFGHGLGHGVGLEVHEEPYLGTTLGAIPSKKEWSLPLSRASIVPGLGGVRIEDVVVLENGKARVLSHARKLTPAGV